MIFLVRHGQTEFNREDRFQGRADSPLTALGRAQAAAVGARLEQIIAAEGGEWSIESSPLGRALSTARIIADRLGLGEPLIEPRLIEVCYGAVEKLTRTEAIARWPHLGALDSMFGQTPEGESFEALRARLAGWLAEIDLGEPQRRIIVAHAGVIRVLRGLCLGLDEAGVRRLDKPQDAIFRLTTEGETRIDCPRLPLDAEQG